ncbi:MAG: hypothetical protein WB996_12760 [Ignavibacteriaceae bacterium]
MIVNYKYLIPIIALLFFSGCGKKYDDGRNLTTKDGLIYKNNEAVPYTGKVKGKVGDKVIEYEVLKGKMNGDFVLHNKNGFVGMKGSIVNGKNEGVWRYYFPDGKIEAIGNFNNDCANSTWKWYFPNGTLKESGNFSIGKKEGEWLSFNSNGSLFIKRNFKDNVQIDSTIIK